MKYFIKIAAFAFSHELFKLYHSKFIRMRFKFFGYFLMTLTKLFSFLHPNSPELEPHSWG